MNARLIFTYVAVIGAAAIFGLTYSLAAPLIAISLVSRGYGTAFVGWNAASYAVGVLLITPALPALTQRFGKRALMIAALLLSAMILAIFPFMPTIWLWFPLRLGLGIGAETLFVLSETWTNDLCDDSIRGRIMASYTAALSLGYAGGPVILSFLGAGPMAYVVGAAIAAIAIVPLANPWVVPPLSTKPTSLNPLAYVRMAPIAMATTLLNAGVETAGLSFITLYATGLGWTESQGARLLSTLMFGAIVLQLPIGLLADRMDRRRLAFGLAVISALGALLWPSLLGRSWLAFATVFVWGGLFVGIYTVMLSIVGSRFSGGVLVGIYAVMGLVWGVGALVGPSLAGLALTANASLGLPVFVATSCAVFAAFMITQRNATQ